MFLSTSWPALAQTAPPLPPAETDTEAGDPEQGGYDEEEEEEAIVVTGSRAVPRGSVIGDIAPEITLDARDIRAYGVGDLGELLEELSPLAGSIQGRGGGQPVVLLGGRRISGFREIRDLPPEAVSRVDILPEEVALKYGYRADQKVVNFVLRRRFEAVTAELETTQATAGGHAAYEGDVNYLRIAEGSRLSIDAEYKRSTPLFETERDVIDPDPDRSLLSASDAVELNGTYNRTIFGNVSATLSAELEGENIEAALGRAESGSRRLLRDRRNRNASLGYALNGDRVGWRWSLDGGYARERSNRLTDRETETGLGRDRAKSVAETIETEATASGDVFGLPAGAVAATAKVGFKLRDIASKSTRGGRLTETDLSRDQANAQLNLDFPLFEDGPVGSLSVNANGQVEQLSDFGTLSALGYGFNWEPADEVRLIGSMTREDGAPSIQQLGDPLLATPNVRVFDIATGQTVDVTRIEGGNPDLLADNRRVMKLGLTVEPIDDLALLVNYADTRIRNAVASFPTPAPEIEAAFPDRFERDADGALFRIDSRPVAFQRVRQRQLRWGLNWSETLEAPPPTGADGRPLSEEQIEELRAARREQRDAARGTGTERDGRRGGGRGSGSGREGRVTLSLFHTWRLTDTILIRRGVPELDLLGGSAAGDRGGRPRHEVQLRAGYSRNGLGARLQADWQSATRVRTGQTSGASSPRDLRFGALATVNLRLFADLAQQRALVRSMPFVRGSRLTLAIDNLFDQRLDVRDSMGAVPVGYQPDLLDPLGRSVRLEFRKLFF
ncbi:hypothetical protein ACFQRC_08330 [Enterovirga sp. GCM10030262]|uniref:hypothetical protein n=1 Tax=Enterovirga sp. GCM10030262 TaxID=3273391 RepID=UPI0036139066